MSFSTNKDTKYIRLESRLTAAFGILPVTSRVFANFTSPTLASLILFSITAIFLFVYFVV